MHPVMATLIALLRRLGNLFYVLSARGLIKNTVSRLVKLLYYLKRLVRPVWGPRTLNGSGERHLSGVHLSLEDATICHSQLPQGRSASLTVIDPQTHFEGRTGGTMVFSGWVRNSNYCLLFVAGKFQFSSLPCLLRSTPKYGIGSFHHRIYPKLVRPYIPDPPPPSHAQLIYQLYRVMRDPPPFAEHPIIPICETSRYDRKIKMSV